MLVKKTMLITRKWLKLQPHQPHITTSFIPLFNASTLDFSIDMMFLSRRLVLSSCSWHRQSHRLLSSASSIPDDQLCWYWDTRPPSPQQLSAANRFFRLNRPHAFYFASRFFTIPISTVPEVALLGRSNVGKSSLINALLFTDLCHTSSKPGRTRTMNAFAVGGDGTRESAKMVLLDMPGYGKGSREDWGVEIMKYLSSRKQLRRAFLLIDCLHGVKQSDKDVLALMRQYAVPHQVVLSKVDRLVEKASQLGKLTRLMQELKDVVQPGAARDGPPALGELIACSTNPKPKRNVVLNGVPSLRWALLSAAGISDSLHPNKPAQKSPVE